MHLHARLLPLIGFVLVAMFAAANAIPAAGEDAIQPTPSALSTNPTGWEDIMPAPDLKGWFRVALNSKLTRQQWHVENGTLVCDGDGGRDVLLLDRKVRNCIFHVEFCLTKVEGPKNYNSGVFIRTSRDAAIWHQAQVGSLFGGYWFGVTPDGATTKNFKIPSLPCRVKAAGEWNVYELTAQGRNLTLWVNGFPCAPFHDCGLDEGYLGVQGEGSLITFRNLKLKILP
ncbi:MAG TPA: DUF1080 domain-containing protein [Candidatus Methylacidiphilales bacterium]|jgi:hypothetical protein|nr:DUF1080 domain-containing protein [Candidatus Methylacidiphilales bacterium]